MEISSTNVDRNNKKELYRLTKSTSMRVQDIDPGTSIPVEKWAIYREENNKGEMQTVLAVIGGGIKLTTISKTFIDSFNECLDIMDGEPFSIVITGGTSKGGRKFVNCELDCD